MSDESVIPEPIEIRGFINPDEVIGINVYRSREDYYRYWRGPSLSSHHLKAENARLRDIVKEAYEEGWDDGYDAPQFISRDTGPIVEGWKNSVVLKELSKSLTTGKPTS